MSKNYLWFMPSLISANNPTEFLYRPYDMGENDETYDGEIDGVKVAYKGLQTNIAATKYVVCSLKKEQEKLTKIIMLCSEEVLTNNLNNGITFPADGTVLTTYEYYTNTISKWLSDNGYSDEEIKNIFVKIPLENINPGAWQEMSEPLKEVKRLFGIETGKNSSENGNLYIDYTGGARSASMLIIFFAKMLQRDGMTVKKVLYSNIIRGQKINQIEDCIDTYNLFDLLEAQTEARFGKTDKAQEYVTKKKNTRLAQMAEETNIAARKNKAKQFDTLSQQEKRLYSLTDEMSIEEQFFANNFNDVRRNFGAENSCKQSIEQGDSSEAAQIIRENIFEILQEKRILIWKATFIRGIKNQQTAFFAYISYYASYIKFVKELLKHLNDNADKPEAVFRNLYIKYIEEKTTLTMSSREHTNVNVNAFTEREFNEVNAELVAEQNSLRNADIAALANSNAQSVELISRAYDSKIRQYMDTYYSTGFPFANWYGKRSYTNCGYKWINGVKETQWINRIYLQSLKRALNKLAKMPVDERKNKLALMIADENEILNYFSPVCIDSLFVLNGRSFKEFGPIMISINEIRLIRNEFIHDKNSKEFERANALASEIMAWIDSKAK